MLLPMKRFVGAISLLAAALLAGCQAAPEPPPRSSLVATTQGVVCRECKVSTVKVPVEDPRGRIVGYRSHKAMECPDCADVEGTFAEGAFTRHVCGTCGDSIVICTLH